MASHRSKSGLFLAGLAMGALNAAAAPGDEHAKALLAYQRGDVVAAMAALQAPAAAGHAPSQTMLAFILDHADFPEEAAALYRRAATQDDAEAHAGIANLLLTGRGVARDEKAAMQHFSKAALLGHAASVLVVADLWLARQPAEAEGPIAVAALQRAAQAGHLPAIDALAEGHRSGRFGLPVDTAQAAAWRSRAAERRRAVPAGAAARPAMAGSAP